MRSPPARRSRWPYYRSAGHRLFSLRVTLSRGRGCSNGLECDSNFVRCLILLSWMTSCTVGIPRSLWIISSVTYHRVSTIALNIIDWHLYKTAILDFQTQPHNHNRNVNAHTRSPEAFEPEIPVFETECTSYSADTRSKSAIAMVEGVISFAVQNWREQEFHVCIIFPHILALSVDTKNFI